MNKPGLQPVSNTDTVSPIEGNIPLSVIVQYINQNYGTGFKDENKV